LVRRAATELDRSVASATDREVRVGLNRALAKLYRVEDEIVRALGVS
jgi:hypothetical protein